MFVFTNENEIMVRNPHTDQLFVAKRKNPKTSVMVRLYKLVDDDYKNLANYQEEHWDIDACNRLAQCLAALTSKNQKELVHHKSRYSYHLQEWQD